MVHVWFLNHRGHGLIDRPVAKLIVSVFIPDSLEVKVRPPEMLLQESQTTSMRYACCRYFKVGMPRDYKAWGGKVGITMCLYRLLGWNLRVVERMQEEWLLSKHVPRVKTDCCC